MNSDYTQQQSLGGLRQSEKLSMQSTVPPADVPGYSIDKLLGEGAFGQVWLGNDLNTGRQVAIKFYLHSGGVDWSLLRREVKHLVNMSTGRYIVQVLNVGWEATPAYYVMEFLENGSLEDLIRAQGAMAIPESVTMLREIADGLSFAHSKGVLHCDLKPANVVLDHDFRPRLADFGQSRMSDDQTPSLGTLFFMAPEQADLDAVPEAAWDVYALGAIAYTMLVGSPPYRTPDVVETLDTASSLPDRLKRYRETIYDAPRPRLHYRRRRIDKRLCQIVDRCLSVKPEKRYQNVQQVIGALDSWDRARTRRPLYLLGIVGPLLLLLLMLVFLGRSISVANEMALAGVKATALESNRFASMFAARTLEKEIEGLFLLVESEAQRPELRERIETTIAETKASLNTLTFASRDDSAEIRANFLENAVREVLESHLDERLSALGRRSKEDGTTAIFDSLLAIERRGVNIASSFAITGDHSNTPVGRNWSYRSYFNGMTADGLSGQSYPPTRLPSLSASFLSTSSGKWKIAVSAPVWRRQGTEQAEDKNHESEQPLAVLVLTINLGDFGLLRSEALGEENQFAVLIDGRRGHQLGNLLHHPHVHDLRAAATTSGKPPQIALPVFETLRDHGGSVKYLDPASSLNKSSGFSGSWIAAMSQVRLPRDNTGEENPRSMSDLWVLVQERSSKIEAPISRLSARLTQNSYGALASVLAVVAVLWFFVLRLKVFSETGNGSGSGFGTRTSGSTSTVDHGR